MLSTEFNMTYVRNILLFALLTVTQLGFSPTAEACSCMPPDLVRSVSDSDHVIRGKVRGKLVFGSNRYFRFRIKRTYKGCYEPGEAVYLQSSASSSMCGQDLNVNGRYLITGNAATAPNGAQVISFNLCGYNTLFSSTTADERTYLNNRELDCPNYQGCPDGSPTVSCTVDPCQNAPSCSGGPCVENFCGGCNREYYNTGGEAVCATNWTVTPP
jgi:hypothetical protein